jgi:hypothetical protein
METTHTTYNTEAACAALNSQADDDNLVSINLPSDYAHAILTARGWTSPALRKDGAWVAPDGRRIWETDEALTIALAVEYTQVTR